MTTSALITKAIELLEGTSAVDSDEATRRTRVLTELQRVYNRLWRSRDWGFRQVATPSTVTVPDGIGYIVMPATYDGLGRQGGVYHTTQGYELEQKPVGLMRARKLAGGGTRYRTSTPRYFSVYGQDGTTFRDLLQIDVNAGAVGLSVVHNRTPPTLLDDSATPANDNLLKQFPEAYHEIVLQPVLLAKLAQLRGEMNATAYEQEFNVGVSVMLRNEQPQQAGLPALPSFFGG